MLLWITLLHLCVLAYAAVGGVFLAFSDFIMRSLSLSDAGASTMQTINREVFRWVFMTLFLGLVPLSVGITIIGLWMIAGTAQLLIVIGALVYLFGVFGVTVFCNVPMNNTLAKLEKDTETKSYWENVYLPRWTFWNSMRTVACLLSAGFTLAGLLVLASNEVLH